MTGGLWETGQFGRPPRPPATPPHRGGALRPSMKSARRGKSGNWRSPGRDCRRCGDSGSGNQAPRETPKQAKPIGVKCNCFIRIGHKLETPNPTRLNLLFTGAYGTKMASFWLEDSGTSSSPQERLPASAGEALGNKPECALESMPSACGSGRDPTTRSKVGSSELKVKSRRSKVQQSLADCPLLTGGWLLLTADCRLSTSVML